MGERERDRDGGEGDRSTRAHTDTHTYTHTHTLSLSFSLSFSFTHSHTLSLSPTPFPSPHVNREFQALLQPLTPQQQDTLQYMRRKAQNRINARKSAETQRKKRQERDARLVLLETENTDLRTQVSSLNKVCVCVCVCV